MALSFDGETLTIIIPTTGVYSADLDFYSDWKEWVLLADNAKFPPAFDTTGGDIISATTRVAPYFFLRNDLGWRIKAPEETGEITIEGNVFPRDSESTMFIPPIGAFTVVFRQIISSKATVEVISGEAGSSDWTATEREQIRKVLGIIGTKSTPDGNGQIQELLDKANKINKNTKLLVADSL